MEHFRIGDVTIQRVIKSKLGSDEEGEGDDEDRGEEQNDEPSSEHGSEHVSEHGSEQGFDEEATYNQEENEDGQGNEIGGEEEEEEISQGEQEMPPDLEDEQNNENSDYQGAVEEEAEEEEEVDVAPVSVMESEDLLRKVKEEPNSEEEDEDEDVAVRRGEAEQLLESLVENQSQIKDEPQDEEDEMPQTQEEEGDPEDSNSSLKRKSNDDPEDPQNKKKKTGDDGSDDGDKSNSERKVSNLRRNIREVMDETQLDEATLAAQRQEMERLRRVQDQQKYLREVQKQITVSRVQNKTQTKVLSLLTGGGANILKTTSVGSPKPSTVLVKLNSGSGPAQVLNKKTLEVLRSGSNNGDLKSNVCRLPSTKSGMVTPSVSIAPVKPATPSAKSNDSDIVEISSSSDEDDCIVISEPSEDESDTDQEDTANSGMHTNDLFNIPDEQGRVLINVGKPENDPEVFLAPQIARIIKPHQIGGVRFMFDNVVESIERCKTSPGFGCILAHSMGLGKTLQVVSFCDVFLRDTGAKSVMCIMPINTLQNWLAEFNMWLPQDPTMCPLAGQGEVRPRNFSLFVLNDLHKTLAARAKVVQEWSREGGVLLIGYEMYRQLSMRKNIKPRKGKKKIPDEDLDDEKVKPLLDDVYEALVKPGPDLVICDEGHRIKNSHASISAALKQIRTKRRIVLTGYPLQNNLLEYWCMVDFVRPNYLGSKAEFSNMFERPIQNGQCIDSTPQDIRLMRYRAHVLHSLLEGFVQRRSHAVLRNSLPQKEEYVLLVRMTAFQRKLYDKFMNDVVRTKAVPNPLKAFAVCCKIWNHPDILYNFLKKREMDELQDLDIDEAVLSESKPSKDKKGKSKKGQANQKADTSFGNTFKPESKDGQIGNPTNPNPMGYPYGQQGYPPGFVGGPHPPVYDHYSQGAYQGGYQDGWNPGYSQFPPGQNFYQPSDYFNNQVKQEGDWNQGFYPPEKKEVEEPKSKTPAKKSSRKNSKSKEVQKQSFSHGLSGGQVMYNYNEQPRENQQFQDPNFNKFPFQSPPPFQNFPFNQFQDPKAQERRKSTDNTTNQYESNQFQQNQYNQYSNYPVDKREGQMFDQKSHFNNPVFNQPQYQSTEKNQFPFNQKDPTKTQFDNSFSVTQGVNQMPPSFPSTPEGSNERSKNTFPQSHDTGNFSQDQSQRENKGGQFDTKAQGQQYSSTSLFENRNTSGMFDNKTGFPFSNQNTERDKHLNEIKNQLSNLTGQSQPTEKAFFNKKATQDQQFPYDQGFQKQNFNIMSSQGQSDQNPSQNFNSDYPQSAMQPSQSFDQKGPFPQSDSKQNLYPATSFDVKQNQFLDSNKPNQHSFYDQKTQGQHQSQFYDQKTSNPNFDPKGMNQSNQFFDPKGGNKQYETSTNQQQNQYYDAKNPQQQNQFFNPNESSKNFDFKNSNQQQGFYDQKSANQNPSQQQHGQFYDARASNQCFDPQQNQFFNKEINQSFDSKQNQFYDQKNVANQSFDNKNQQYQNQPVDSKQNTFFDQKNPNMTFDQKQNSFYDQKNTQQEVKQNQYFDPKNPNNSFNMSYDPKHNQFYDSNNPSQTSDKQKQYFDQKNSSQPTDPKNQFSDPNNQNQNSNIDQKQNQYYPSANPSGDLTLNQYPNVPYDHKQNQFFDQKNPSQFPGQQFDSKQDQYYNPKNPAQSYDNKQNQLFDTKNFPQSGQFDSKAVDCKDQTNQQKPYGFDQKSDAQRNVYDSKQGMMNQYNYPQNVEQRQFGGDVAANQNYFNQGSCGQEFNSPYNMSENFNNQSFKGNQFSNDTNQFGNLSFEEMFPKSSMQTEKESPPKKGNSDVEKKRSQQPNPGFQQNYDLKNPQSQEKDKNFPQSGYNVGPNQYGSQFPSSQMDGQRDFQRYQEHFNPSQGNAQGMTKDPSASNNQSNKNEMFPNQQYMNPPNQTPQKNQNYNFSNQEEMKKVNFPQTFQGNQNFPDSNPQGFSSSYPAQNQYQNVNVNSNYQGMNYPSTSSNFSQGQGFTFHQEQKGPNSVDPQKIDESKDHTGEISCQTEPLASGPRRTAEKVLDDELMKQVDDGIEGSKDEKKEEKKPEGTVKSGREEPGIPYDWAIELMKGYVPGKIEESAKMLVFFCILEESIALGDRILVFSQSLFTLNLMEELLQQQFVPGRPEKWMKNVNYYRLDGSTSASEREKLINEFNSNPNFQMFLVSTRAGSLGINLVGANRVIVFDASWNPCHDTQAVCRVYRYGQKKPCFVYRLVSDNCLEKKIYDRQINKQGMADRVVDECNPEAHLSIKEVTSLCWDDKEDTTKQIEVNTIKDNYIDVVIQKVLEKHATVLTKEPFHHESLLVERKDKKLSQAEKRLAKRSYELEKQANSNSNRPVYGTPGTMQTRGIVKPMASVRPMQSEQLMKDGKPQGRGWIPAAVWQRQGMSAQEMTLPLDVVIPTNAPDKASIVLKAGQKVMVLKSPKGIYMQLESGKIIAIRTAVKMGLKDKKPGETKPTEIKKDLINRPRGTVLPTLRSSSVSILPRSSFGANIRPGIRPVRIPSKTAVVQGKTVATARPYMREPEITMTPLKKKITLPGTSSQIIGSEVTSIEPMDVPDDSKSLSSGQEFDGESDEESKRRSSGESGPSVSDTGSEAQKDLSRDSIEKQGESFSEYLDDTDKPVETICPIEKPLEPARPLAPTRSLERLETRPLVDEQLDRRSLDKQRAFERTEMGNPPELSKHDNLRLESFEVPSRSESSRQSGVTKDVRYSTTDSSRQTVDPSRHLFDSSASIDSRAVFETPRAIIDPGRTLMDPARSMIDPSRALLDPTRAVMDPSRALLDPSRPIIDPSRPLIDPSRPIIDSSRPIIDPSRPIMDPARIMMDPSRPADRTSGDPSRPSINPSRPSHDPPHDPVRPSVDNRSGVDPSRSTDPNRTVARPEPIRHLDERKPEVLVRPSEAFAPYQKEDPGYKAPAYPPSQYYSAYSPYPPPPPVYPSAFHRPEPSTSFNYPPYSPFPFAPPPPPQYHPPPQ